MSSPSPYARQAAAVEAQNRVRTPREFWEHLCAVIADKVTPEMTNDSWAEGFGISGYFPMNQFWNDMSAEEIASDVYQVAEKKKIYSICLRNAMHKRRPASN